MNSYKISIYCQTFFFLLVYNTVFSQCPDGYVLKDSNLVFNGDFNFGNEGFTTDYKYVRNYHWTNPQPMHWGTYNILHNANHMHERFAECLTPKGFHNPMYAADGHYDQVNIWQQNVNVQPNTFYYYEAYFSSTCCWDGVMTEFGFFANGKELDIIASDDTCDWQHFKFLWNSENNKIANLEIQNVETEGNGNDFLLDDISLKECVKPQDLIKKPKKVVLQQIDYNSKNYAYIDPKRQIRVQGIQFYKNGTEFKNTSFASLDVIAHFLETKEEVINVEIIVHTGIPEKTKIQSKKLSQRRAETIKKYLISKGIKLSRIFATGKGYQQPIKRDMRKETIQLNERVMFRFFGNEHNIIK